MVKTYNLKNTAAEDFSCIRGKQKEKQRDRHTAPAFCLHLSKAEAYTREHLAELRMNQHSDPKYRKFRVEQFFFAFLKNLIAMGHQPVDAFNRLDTGILLLIRRR